MMLNSVDLPQPDGPITREELAGLHRQRHIVDGGEHAVRRLELLDDAVDGENRLRRSALRARRRVRTASRPRTWMASLPHKWLFAPATFAQS